MKNVSIDYIRPSIKKPILGKIPYWESYVKQDIAKGNWSKTNIEEHINLVEWQTYLHHLPKDPYVDARWKRMSWLYLDNSGHINTLDDCPMAQGGEYNDAVTMADKLRHYPALEKDFLQRKDVQEFIKAWADLWEIHPKEPILMQINGVKGNHPLDPLQGQGIHQDGSHFLSILVINRKNVVGGTNTLYSDKTGRHPMTETTLVPGEVMHIRDDQIFHNISQIQPLNKNVPFERFIIIINSRFNDPFQNKVLRQHFPDAILYKK